VHNAQTVRSAVPDLEAIAGLDYRGVALTAPGAGGTDYVLRFFGPRVGIAEDPVTGSAQCLLGPWWASRLGRTRLEVAQLSGRGGRLRVEVLGERVRVAGQAVTVLRGAVEGAMADALDAAGGP
jgi:PhzF family phenazine biosynthesis protein